MCWNYLNSSPRSYYLASLRTSKLDRVLFCICPRDSAVMQLPCLHPHQKAAVWLVSPQSARGAAVFFLLQRLSAVHIYFCIPRKLITTSSHVMNLLPQTVQCVCVNKINISHTVYQLVDIVRGIAMRSTFNEYVVFEQND